MSVTPLLNEATERNKRVAARYDELDHAGKHGHYETLFQVVREEIERLSPASGGVSGDRGLEIQIETMTTIAARREEQFFKCREKLSASNAALADALGLLRDVVEINPNKGGIITNVRAFLAKHGKTEEAKTSDAG